jgi:cyclin E
LEYTSEELEEKYNMETNIEDEEENLLMSRNSNYFHQQNNLNPRMRTILLDWVMEVCGQLSFKRATFHTAVVLIDIFLSKVENLQTNLLQLAGITCLIIAAKNEVFKFK